MKSFGFLLAIGIILIFTRLFGNLSEKFKIPQVVGAIIAGIFLGPSFLNILEETDFLYKTAQIGVILLMFLAGLETDLKEFKKNAIPSFVIAIFGIILPLFFGALAYFYFYKETGVDSMFILKAVFIGVILTATSVSITVETLREMGKLKGKIGTVILGAAIIDDIAGIIILTFITSLTTQTVDISSVITKIILFFVLIFILGAFIKSKKAFIEKHNGKIGLAIYFVAFALIMAYVAEHFFGIADITGAYFAGILLCNTVSKKYVESKVSILSCLIFSPIFFADIGLKTELKGFTLELIIFTIILLVVAVLTKIIGCWIGGKICKFDNASALCIGVGMVSRGEVALILAQKGASLNLIDKSLFPAIIAVVIATTLLTPILLKLSFSKNNLV